MDNKYLWKRKNRYWVRVRVPDKVRDIIGTVELCLNLYTSDLQEANVLKHAAVSKLKKRIESARKIKDKQGPETTKEELLKQYAQAICTDALRITTQSAKEKILSINKCSVRSHLRA